MISNRDGMKPYKKCEKQANCKKLRVNRLKLTMPVGPGYFLRQFLKKFAGGFCFIIFLFYVFNLVAFAQQTSRSTQFISPVTADWMWHIPFSPPLPKAYTPETLSLAVEDNSIFKNHVEEIIDGRHEYTVEHGGTMDGENCRSPIGFSPWEQTWESNLSVRIENVGEIDVINPWLSNGRNNLRTTKEIVDNILEPGMSDKEKAIAIWKWAVSHRFHWGTGDYEGYDPVKVFNVYGYNLCSHQGGVLGLLLDYTAGLKTGYFSSGLGVWGHALNDIFFDGKWNLFDGDLANFYLLRDNDTMASQYDISRDHDLAKRVHSYGILSNDSRFGDEVTASLFSELNFEGSILLPPDVSTRWTLSAVHFTSPDEGWAVGEDLSNQKGILLHNLRGSWIVVTPNVLSGSWRLNSVHFMSPDEGWAIGEDQENNRAIVLRYSNTSWITIPLPEVSAHWKLLGIHFASLDRGLSVGYDYTKNKPVLINFERPNGDYSWEFLSEVFNHNMNMVLRPGEALVYVWGQPEEYKYHGYFDIHSYYPDADKIFNGVWDYHPDLNSSYWQNGAKFIENIVSGEHGITSESGKVGTIIWKLSSPYVFVGGQIISEDSGAQFALSWDGVKWQDISDRNLDNFFPPDGWPRYTYFLRCQLTDTTWLSKINILNDIQIAPLSLPGMIIGKNKFVYTDESGGKRNIRITHEWKENSSFQPPLPPELPVFPADQSEIEGTQFVFKWQTPVDPDGNAIGDYHFQLSNRPDLKWPLSPNFDKLISRTGDEGKAQYTLPYGGLLTPDQEYYWRVRAKSSKGVWGPWSNTWKFIPRGPAAPINVRIDCDSRNGTGVLKWDPGTTGRQPARYRIYGSDEKGFSVSDTPYTVYSIEPYPFPANFVAETQLKEMEVIGQKVALANANKAYYRVVAVDEKDNLSGPSDYATLSRPFIYSQPILTGVAGVEYRYQVLTIRSLGDVQAIDAEGIYYNSDFWDIEYPKFSIEKAPGWLTIDADGVLSGIPNNIGQFEVILACIINNAKAVQRFIISIGSWAVDHFEFNNISAQGAGSPFSATISLKDAYSNTVTSFSGIATLSDTTGTISPSVAGTFSNGVWTGSMRITKAQSNVAITATADGKTGSSNLFEVLPLTLSGFVRTSGGSGISGVVMNGLPGNPTTTWDGSYSGTVDYGWSGTISPYKAGYNFSPSSASYINLTSDQTQDYVGTLQTFTISGFVRNSGGQAISGVTISGLPDNPVTAQDGSYSATVDYGWSGTVTPSKAGYNFSPSPKTYTNVTANQTQDYTGILQTFTISGFVRTSGGTGISGVVMSGLPANPTTAQDGSYSGTVDYGWSGTVTPTKAGYNFSPLSLTYTNVSSNQTQDYIGTLQTFTISGTIMTANGQWMPEVTMNGLPGNPLTLADGSYSATVDYGWSGTVTPTKGGYDFNPASIGYTNVTSNKIQDFIGTEQLGSLQVEIEPQRAMDEGAKWRRVGTTTWHNSQDTESNIPPGDYTVEFKEITGWDKPANQEVTILNGQTEKITMTYIQQAEFGSLQVTISPQGAVDVGAQWRRKGNRLNGENFEDGDTTDWLCYPGGSIEPTNLRVASGNYSGIVDFPPVGSYKYSACYKIFSTQTEKMIVELDVMSPNTVMNRQVLISDAPTTGNENGFPSNATVVGISYVSGQHSSGIHYFSNGNEIYTGIDFTPLKWNRFKFDINILSQTYDLYMDGNLIQNDIPFYKPAISLSYIHLTGEYEDAYFFIDNLRITEMMTSPWYNSSYTETNIFVGQHTVEFKEIPGWDKPANQNLMITKNQTTQTTGTYVDIIAPSNPTSCTETNGVSNNTWQNTISDPAFTWSGASDNGSGLKGYYWYFGPDPNADPTNWTNSTGCDPSPVSSGTYYLKVKTEDNAGNKSSPVTLFTFKYYESVENTIYVSKDGFCGGNNPCFPNIQNGIALASIPSTIKITQETYDEDIVLDFDQVIILQGGWDTNFTSNPSSTTIQGSITITHGTMIIESIIVE